MKEKIIKTYRINKNLTFMDKIINLLYPFDKGGKVIGYCGYCSRDIFKHFEFHEATKNGLCIYCNRLIHTK